jgi:extracellular elastinolytic metalloproteinase
MLRALNLLLFLAICNLSYAQNSIVQNFLNQNLNELGVTADDVSEWSISSQHTSSVSGAEHIYIVQEYAGIEIYHAVANFVIKDGQVAYVGNRLQSNIVDRVNGANPTISSTQAIQLAADHFAMGSVNNLQLLSQEGNLYKYNNGGISLENISVKLVYQEDEDNNLRLAWDLNLYQLDALHWWSVRVDANNGAILDIQDWVLSCSFGDGCTHDHSPRNAQTAKTDFSPMLNSASAAPNSTEQYNIFPEPVESPNHGGRALLVNPADPTSSPFGWHDTNGATGPEFTITRGNNTHAYEDQGNNNAPGFSPDGGATLDFDFPLNLAQDPTGYQTPAVVNLFYWVNLMHDVWYHYGFDEASGNFQENNYGNGGFGGDYVQAEAQDGSGLNNANMATPNDGTRPRIQMYLWSAPASSNDLFVVNSPAGLFGARGAEPASFGAPMPTTALTADLAVYNDATPDIEDACEPVANGADLSGRIVLIRRGTCPFVDKVARAEAAGALAVVMVNNVAGAPIVMGGTDPGIGIPSLMISQADGDALIAAVNGGQTVNATIQDRPTFRLDGDFDNGIIAHEYGHGISTRLTGGAGTSCLNNAEQMGEGWSDWFALMLTIEPGDLGTDARGIGTYAIGEPTSGGGIRPLPYSTDFGINFATYDLTNNTGAISQPHGIGFVWCTMLWDLTWAFIDVYGYDSDLYNGTGGNNIVMELVTEALKIQGCSPGFVDGRDAIIAADQLINGGANACLIWNAFAARGLGNGASQGGRNSRTDQTEDFSVPAGILSPMSACIASFNLPIELLAFDAKVNPKNQVELDWTTTSELNNDYFTVERSLDGQNFEAIAEVKSKGDGNTIRYYDALDERPYKGTSYYRLKQNDLDGSYSYSKVKAVEINGWNQEVQVVPNPNNGQFNLVLDTDYEYQLSMEVYNVLGELVLQEQFVQPKGLNQHAVDLSDYPAGSYIVQLRDPSGQINMSKKFIVE